MDLVEANYVDDFWWTHGGINARRSNAWLALILPYEKKYDVLREYSIKYCELDVVSVEKPHYCDCVG